jgi:two-component system, cell cycle sensor histidine kinase and response regulator CckA
MNAHAQIAEQATAQDCATHEQLAGAEKILLVEDEAFVREVTSEVLQSAGYRVLTAKDAVEAARAYEQNCGEVDLLLTDVILPGETGCALAAKLRRSNPGLNVLLVTGYVEQMELREAGCAEPLVKPFSAGVLLRRVREAIDCRGFQATGEGAERERGRGENGLRRACGLA